MIEPEPMSARVASAERLQLEARRELGGTVTATKSSALGSRVMATVTAVHVGLGDEVRAGQVLLTIDPTAAEGQATQSRGALSQAQAALTLAQRNYERFEALAATKSASELELDLARMQLQQALGAVEQARGALDSARSVARESQVVAPFAGRVVERLVEVGDLAAPGRPLVRLESTVGRRLVVAVPETAVLRSGLALDHVVPVQLDAQPGLGEIEGRVVEISPGPDPLTHRYTVTIELPPVGVAAGAAGRAFFSEPVRAVVRVPPEALIESGGLTLVVVRDEDGRAWSRVVTVGASDNSGRVEILSGLEGGETVALGLTLAPAAGARFEVIQ